MVVGEPLGYQCVMLIWLGQVLLLNGNGAASLDTCHGQVSKVPSVEWFAAAYFVSGYCLHFSRRLEFVWVTEWLARLR